MRILRWTFALLLLLQPPTAAFAAVGSMKEGGALLPFTSNVLTGEFRGQQHCFVCSLLPGRPSVLVFSRRTDELAAGLLRQLNSLVHSHRSDHLFSWFVLLGKEGTDNETALESRGEAFAKGAQAAFVPVTALAEQAGPPGYNLPVDADVVVLVTRGRNILVARSYRRGEWSAPAEAAVLHEIERNLHLH